MKRLLTILILAISLWADSPITDGLYISNECSISFVIKSDKYGSSYTLLNHKNTKKHKINILEENTYLEFQNLHRKYYNTGDNNNFINGEILGNTQALLENSYSFVIQNYGNSMNPYITFDKCTKYLHYNHINSIQKLEKYIKKNTKKYSDNFYYELKNIFPMNIKNVESYNNIAYYMYKQKAYTMSLNILTDILLNFPSRKVAHYNYAQNAEKILKNKIKNGFYLEQKNVDKHFLSYIAQMLFDKKENKIPKKIQNSYSSYYELLINLNKTLKEKYQVLDITKGYLNNDDLEDISLVIEFVDSNNIEELREFAHKPSNSNKRIWLIYFNENNHYKLFAQNKHFIYSDEATNCDDPFDSIKIKNKNLFLNEYFWCSMGSWSSGNKKYQIIYKNNKLILAGIESRELHRGSGEGKNISTNYLSKKVKIQKTINLGDNYGKPIWEKLPLKKPIYFEEMQRE
ncbi:hypothetical protein [Arcobacter sp. LA11]|uniref:hypothetical protein n=1 Tax=Arcobacter sp. LA11 TaxID=1898176 RepID=UPI00116070D5|nr:hypothetical protein [Arcobacter sp. LA11]